MASTAVRMVTAGGDFYYQIKYFEDKIPQIKRENLTP